MLSQASAFSKGTILGFLIGKTSENSRGNVVEQSALSSTTKTAFAIGRPLGSEASTVLARNFLDAIILFPLCVQSRFVLGRAIPLAGPRVIRHLPDSNVTVRLDTRKREMAGRLLRIEGQLAFEARAASSWPI